jgi:HEAT repeat protein
MAGGLDPPEVLLLRRAAAACDPEERASVIAVLHARTDRAAFDAACALTRSGSAPERELGLDVLGQIGYPAGRPNLEDTLPVVLACCADEEPEVLAAAIMAMGHMADTRGLLAVLAHVAHPSPDVKFAVAVALPLLAGDAPAAGVADALVRLSRDPDPEIRDWATAGLNEPFDVDTAEIRDALAERLTDTEGDIAGEALLGLAQRRDPRTLLPLLAWLDGGDAGNLIVEAAAALGAPEALPALLRLKAAGWQDRRSRPSLLDDAIRACSRLGEHR